MEGFYKFVTDTYKESKSENVIDFPTGIDYIKKYTGLFK